MLAIADVEAFREKHNNTGLYLTAYRYGSEDQSGLLWADFFYADFDANDLFANDKRAAELAWRNIREDVRLALSALNVYFGIPAEMPELFFSGKKGISLQVPAVIMGIKPHENLNMIFKNIALGLKKYMHHDTLDTQIYDRIRLWRMPNSIHEKSGLYKIPITLNELTTVGLEDMKHLAKEPREVERMKTYPIPRAIHRYQHYVETLNLNPRDNKPLKPIKETPPCINYLLEGDVTSGARNNTAAALANFMRQAGKSIDETKQIMADWNDTHCSPPLPGRELVTTVMSAYQSPKTWGCNALSVLSACDSENCKLRPKQGGPASGRRVH